MFSQTNVTSSIVAICRCVDLIPTLLYIPVLEYFLVYDVFCFQLPMNCYHNMYILFEQLIHDVEELAGQYCKNVTVRIFFPLIHQNLLDIFHLIHIFCDAVKAICNRLF